MKVGKEEIIGCLTALETWLNLDEKKIYGEWNGRVERIRKLVDTVPGVKTDIYIPDDGNRFPTLRVSWDQAAWGFTTSDCVQQAARKRSRYRSAGLGQSQPGDGGSRRQSEPQRAQGSRPHRTGFHDHTARAGNHCGANIAGGSERGAKRETAHRTRNLQRGAWCKIECDYCLSACCCSCAAGAQAQLRGSRSCAGFRPPRTASTRPAWMLAITCTSPDRDLAARTALCPRLLRHRSSRLSTISSQLSKPPA